MKKKFIIAIILMVVAITTLIFATSANDQQITINHNDLVYKLNKRTNLDSNIFSLETSFTNGEYEVTAAGLKFFEDSDLTIEVDATYDEKTGEYQIQKGLNQVFVKLPVAFALSKIEETSFAPLAGETVKNGGKSWFTVSNVLLKKTSTNGAQLLVEIKAVNQEIAPRLPVLKTLEGNISGASCMNFDQDHYFTGGYIQFDVDPDFSLNDIQSIAFENMLTKMGSETVAVSVN